MGTSRSWGRGRRPARSHWLVAGALGGIVVVAAACSSGASSSTTTTHAGSSTAGTSGSSGQVSIALANVGSLGTVLVNGSGMTVYRFSHDATGMSNCTGGCLTLWPAVTVPAGTKPVAGHGIDASQLGTITRPDGTTQVTYKGMPLYTYSGDHSAGQATGQNVAGSWFVVTTTGSPSPTSGGAAPTTTTGGGSGGYGY